MLLGTDDIIRYQGNIEITQLGGEVITGYGEISMSKDTGVVFIAQYVNNDLDKFTVGAFNDQGLLEEKRDYTEKTEKDFFNAVNYFEELIKSRQPEEEETPPSVGKFYFFKKSIGRNAYVSIQGMEDIIIDEADIPTVFSPPKTKPLGRLNLKDSTNPTYEPIKAKYALKYLRDEAKEMADANNWNLSDFAVYDMTPYEIGDENEGEAPPDNVNPLNPNDIENEDLEKKPKEKKEKKEKNEPRDKGEPGDDEGEPSDEDGEPGDDKGEPGDDEGDKERQNENQKAKPNKDGEPEDGEPQDSEPGDEGEPGDDEGEPTDEQEPQDDEGDKSGDVGNMEDNDSGKTMPQVNPKDLKEALQNFSNTDDLKKTYRKQKNLITALSSYDNKELGKLLEDLKLPANTNKQQFINLVEKETKTIFN